MVIDPYHEHDGIFVPPVPVEHRDDQYESSGFDILSRMQSEHFWYRGRHRFLLRAANRYLAGTAPRRVVDLGGGCGGWVAYLAANARFSIAEMALADSSKTALEFAASTAPAGVKLYQADLLDLLWEDRWDAAFLLDVLEHIPADARVLREVHKALRPGGLLFVTTPALESFRSWNDEVVHHLRRYSRSDMRRLAEASGFTLLAARYFMFFLSPLLLAARRRRPPLETMSPAEVTTLLARTHRVPGRFVNSLCTAVFAAETPLGLSVPFPWGTSILAVFRK